MASKHFSILFILAALAVTIFLLPSSGQHGAKKRTEKPEMEPVRNLQSKRFATENTVEDFFSGFQPAKSFQGLTLYPEVGTEVVLLLDMAGQIIHQWPVDVARAELLPDCSLLVVHGSKWGLKREPWASLRNTIRRYDWEGAVQWEYKGNESPFHHDVSLLPNGNILSVRSIEVSDPQKLPQRFHAHPGLTLHTDEIVEISPAGEIVWQWRFNEHMDLASCGKYACPPFSKQNISGKKPFDWSHINSVKALPENKWYTSGDVRFRPGNLLVTARNWSTIFVIDKESGSMVWSSTGSYKDGFQYAHEATMIAPGLPGAGNILIFDNGVVRQKSYVVELDPTMNETIWVFDRGDAFFSAAAGSAERLPNGNTLISEDLAGRIFEVTPDQEIVWLYTGKRIRSARASRYRKDICAERMSGSLESVSLQ